MTVIDRYIDLIDEVLLFCRTYDVINYHLQGLNYIRDLQRRVQEFCLRDIEAELLNDNPNQEQIRDRLRIIEFKLCPDDNTCYLVEFPDAFNDNFLGDKEEFARFIRGKLGMKDGNEFIIRFHSILEWINRDTKKLIAKISQWEKLAGINNQPTEDLNSNNYSKELLSLFKNNDHLISNLIGKPDNEIAELIRGWANQRDKFGKPLIENPKNRMQKTFAEELKKANLIKSSIESFRKKL